MVFIRHLQWAEHKRIINSKYNILLFCHAFQAGFLTYNVTPEINVGEFLIDVLDGRLHALIGEEGEPLLWVCAGLWWNESRKGGVAHRVLHPADTIISPSCEHFCQHCTNVVFFHPGEGLRSSEQLSRLWRINISFHTSLTGRIFNLKLPWRSCAGSREMSSSTSQASKPPLESSLFFKLAYSASSHSLIPF